MKISIYDVAKKAGVSVVTVSRVINNATSVRAGNRDKVLHAMQELNYTPNAAARSLAKGRTNVIGLMIPGYLDPFFFKVITAVEKELEKRGYFLALSLDTRTETGDSECYLFQQDRVDGVILVTPLFEDRDIPELKNKRIPFVVIDSQSGSTKYPFVMVDNHKAGKEAAYHLAGLGHSRIAHVGGPINLLTSREREEGFIEGLQEKGFTPYFLHHGDYSVETGQEAIRKHIKDLRLPAAIFAGDDNIAFGIIDEARSLGLRVPEDLSVIGFDDHPYASTLKPELTTFSQPSESLSEKAVELLFKVMEGNVKRLTTLRLEATMVVRNSTSKLETEEI